MSDVQEVRAAIIEAIQLTTSNHGEAPDQRHMYVPPAHVKALRLECNLVIGTNGGLHAKVFLREDQSGRTITDFPDASKLLATKAELTWAPHDLHGLRWQMLCNGPNEHGTRMREVYRGVVGSLPHQRGNAWRLAEEVKRCPDPGWAATAVAASPIFGQ